MEQIRFSDFGLVHRMHGADRAIRFGWSNLRAETSNRDILLCSDLYSVRDCRWDTVVSDTNSSTTPRRSHDGAVAGAAVYLACLKRRVSQLSDRVYPRLGLSTDDSGRSSATRISGTRRVLGQDYLP